MVSRLSNVSTGDRMVPAGARIGRRQFLTTAAAGFVLASSMPSRAFAAQNTRFPSTVLAVDEDPGLSSTQALADVFPAQAGYREGALFPVTSFVDVDAAAEFAGITGRLDSDQFHSLLPTAIGGIMGPATYWPNNAGDSWERLTGTAPASIEAAAQQWYQNGNTLCVVVGAFDQDAATQVWEQNGWQPSGGEGAVWTYGGTESQRQALFDELGIWELLQGDYDGLAFTGDNVMVAGRPDLVVRCLEVAATGESTLAQMDTPGRLLGTHLDGVTEVALLPEPEFVFDVESIMFGLPRDIQTAYRVTEEEIAKAFGPTPAVAGVMLANTPGGPWPDAVEGLPDIMATSTAIIDLEEATEAEGYLEMALARFESLPLTRGTDGEKYVDVLENVDAGIDESGCVRMTFRPRPGATSREDLIGLWFARDLLFLQS